MEAAAGSLSADIYCCSPSLQQKIAVELKHPLIVSVQYGDKSQTSQPGARGEAGGMATFFTVSMLTLFPRFNGLAFLQGKERSSWEHLKETSDEQH